MTIQGIMNRFFSTASSSMVEHQLRDWIGGFLASAGLKAKDLEEDKGQGWFGRINRALNMLKVAGSSPSLLTKIFPESSSGVERRAYSNPGVAGSSPRLSDFIPKISWSEPIGLDECPYMRRWVLDFGTFAIRLHRWQASDDVRAFHDHAWWLLTCVLWGSYEDVSPEGTDLLTVGSIRFRRASHKHTVKILKPGTWTFLVTGPVERRWGFWVKGKLWKRDRYFANNGHHPCDPAGSPVRLRPDGSRI